MKTANKKVKLYQGGRRNATNPALPIARPSLTCSIRESARAGGTLPHLAHGAQEVLVGLGQLDLVEEELHGFHGVELGQGLAEQPDLLKLVLLQEELLLAGARLLDVDGGEDALVHEAAVEVHLHVAGALELLEDHVVHARARVDEGSGHDGERAPLLHVAGGGEEAPGALQRVGVETAGEDLARRRDDRVVGTGEARD